MIVTLTGSNSLLLQQQLHKLVQDFIDAYSDMGVERFDGEEAEYDRMREALESLPFLASKKLVVLRSPSANKQFTEHAERLLKGLPESTDLILIEPKLDKRSTYYKLLKKVTDFTEYNELDGSQLAQWLSQQATANDGSLTTADARYLIERVGANQQLLTHELTKLLTYDKKVTKVTIDLLTEPTPQSTVFQLLDSAFAGNQQRMLQLYREQRANKVEPQAIVAMLAWQLHVIALVKVAGERSDAEISREAKLSPFAVQKSRALARRASIQIIRQQVRALVRLDTALKSSAIDADDAVQAYLLGLG